MVRICFTPWNYQFLKDSSRSSSSSAVALVLSLHCQLCKFLSSFGALQACKADLHSSDHHQPALGSGQSLQLLGRAGCRLSTLVFRRQQRFWLFQPSLVCVIRSAPASDLHEMPTNAVDLTANDLRPGGRPPGPLMHPGGCGHSPRCPEWHSRIVRTVHSWPKRCPSPHHSRLRPASLEFPSCSPPGGIKAPPKASARPGVVSTAAPSAD